MPAPLASSTVDAVLFDYGLVLSGPPSPAAWQRMKDILHAGEAEFHAAYWRPRHDYDRGSLNGEAYWHTVARELDRTLASADLDALLAADIDLWTEPNQLMIDWAAHLQQRGMRTGILSNLGDAMERGILERCAWLGDFAHHTFSHRLLIAKPEPAIYAHAAEGLGVPAPHVLFIDDREDNILAARRAGMQAIQYSSHAAFLEQMRAAGLLHLLPPATNV